MAIILSVQLGRSHTATIERDALLHDRSLICRKWGKILLVPAVARLRRRGKGKGSGMSERSHVVGMVGKEGARSSPAVIGEIGESDKRKGC